MGSFKDLTGMKFNRLTVLRLAEKRGKNYYYECQCDCGNIKLIRAGSITSGGIKSCGCLQREWARKPKGKIGNRYEIYGDTVKVYMTNTGSVMLCDVEDWEKAKDRTWFVNAQGYASTNDASRPKGNHMLRFHRLVMGDNGNLVIDHINRDPLDNRKQNLRFVTQHANTTNQKLRKNNTSGHVGVRYRKSIRKWSARIMVNGKEHALGCFDNIEDAIEARKRGEEKYFQPLFEEGVKNET